MRYVALFYSHFGAIRFHGLCQKAGWLARMSPVPRALSSSCGTCVRYEGERPCPAPTMPEEVEGIFEEGEYGYRKLFARED